MTRCCWTGYLFASNVGVLPVCDPTFQNPRLILGPKLTGFGRICKPKRFRRRLRRALLRPCFRC
jgi:hypothetical protein